MSKTRQRSLVNFSELDGLKLGTRDFAAGKRVKAFSGFERPARLKLDRMQAATSLGDLAALPGNRFEALRGDRKGQYSIRINDQWSDLL
jgi:proteic killer suppression protein